MLTGCWQDWDGTGFVVLMLEYWLVSQVEYDVLCRL